MIALEEEINLIEGCRIGNKHAQEMLYKLYSQSMFSLCIKFSTDVSEAEQIMVKGFSKVFSEIDSYNGLGSFEAWIKSVLLNEANNINQNNLQRMILFNSRHPDKAQGFRKAQRTRFNKPGIVPGEYKKALNRFVLEGYSSEEIAVLMGFTVDSSVAKVERTRTNLKAKISKLATRISYLQL